MGRRLHAWFALALSLTFALAVAGLLKLPLVLAFGRVLAFARVLTLTLAFARVLTLTPAFARVLTLTQPLALAFASVIALAVLIAACRRRRRCSGHGRNRNGGDRGRRRGVGRFSWYGWLTFLLHARCQVIEPLPQSRAQRPAYAARQLLHLLLRLRDSLVRSLAVALLDRLLDSADGFRDGLALFARDQLALVLATGSE